MSNKTSATALQGNSFATTEQTTDDLVTLFKLSSTQRTEFQKEYFTYSANLKSFNKASYNITIEEYCNLVLNNPKAQKIEEARKLKQSGNLEAYKRIKQDTPAITAHAIFDSNVMPTNENYKALNNLVCIDIDSFVDSTTFDRLKQDPYTFIIHKSFGGDGVCIFVKIKKDSNLLSVVNSLAKYYSEEYDLAIDTACKDIRRMRLISSCKKLHYNPSSERYTKTLSDDKFTTAVRKANLNAFTYHNDDLKKALNIINRDNISIADDYVDYINLGYAIYSKYKDDAEGLELYKLICSYSEKYNPKQTTAQYNAIAKSVNINNRTIPFDYFYFLCRKANIKGLTTDKTALILQAVQNNKKSFDEVKEYCFKYDVHIDDNDKTFIDSVINSGKNYSKQISDNFSEFAQLESFILNNYDIYIDEINGQTFINSERKTDRIVNSIYSKAQKSLDINVYYSDINRIIESNEVKSVNKVKELLTNNHHNETGYIEKLVKSINSEHDKEYIKFVFNKWLLGSMHNWLRDINSREVSPLVLLLVGVQGCGKSHFIRHLIPTELNQYIAEAKLKKDNKDSLVKLATNLLLFDDEFSTSKFMDNEAFKAFTDTTIINERLAFRRDAEVMVRRSTLAATGNNLEVLTDPTGNRRILPIEIDSIDRDLYNSIDMVKLWVEVFNLYKDNPNEWKLTKDEVLYLKVHTIKNEYIDPSEELILQHLSLKPDAEYNLKYQLSRNEVLQIFSKLDTAKIINKYNVDDFFKKYQIKCKPFNIKDRGNSKRATFYSNIKLDSFLGDCPF